MRTTSYMNKLRLVCRGFGFLTVCLFSINAFAGDVVERLKQLSVESACFDFPSVFYFDLSFIEDSTAQNTLEVKRYLGRIVKGKEKAYRCDMLFVADSASGREPEMQHLFCGQNGNRWLANETVSSGFYIGELDPKLESPLFVSKCNPFRCAIQGRSEFGKGSEHDLFQTVFNNFEEFEGSTNTLRGNSGCVVKKFTFDRDVDWQVNGSKAYIPKSRYELWKRSKDRPKLKSIDEIKDWMCVSDIETFWMTVPDVGPIPCWVLGKEEGLKANDISHCTDMEAFFFGFQFDNIPLETLFDEKRFTESGLKEDFKIEAIKKMAENAKIEIGAARKKARKNY